MNVRFRMPAGRVHGYIAIAAKPHELADTLRAPVTVRDAALPNGS
jgi:hypothetical protein